MPVAIAAFGIPSCSGLLPSEPCAIVKPPHALIALRPSAPSLPVPDSTTPIASAPRSVASELNSASIDSVARGAECGGCSRSLPCPIVRMAFGGIT